MIYIKWLDLQLFADGGDGGGDGAATGETNAADAGQSRLLELGVPADKIRKSRASKAAPTLPEGAVRKAPQQVAAATPSTEETKPEEEETKPARMTWDEIKADPEYNAEMQKMMQERVRKSKEAETNLAKLTPMLEVLARKHNLDMEKLDYDALAKAVSDEDSYYEEKALEMGVSIETAKKIDQSERDTARRQKEEAQTLEQQKIQRHIQNLEQQGEALKQMFPNFDLRTELQNPAFARMTSPSVGISVEDAYHAIHRKEIQQAAMQVTAQKTAQKISNSIQAGQRRPDEHGTSGQAASVNKFDYAKASKQEREAIKKAIRDAAARGEKLYPG